MLFNPRRLCLLSGRLFGEQPFIGSTLSSAFPLVNHPAFGAIYTAGAGRPEFGGLGSLGMSAALAAHPQLGALSGKKMTFECWVAIGEREQSFHFSSPPPLLSSPLLSEWWRAAEAHGRGAPAFLPSFIGFPPFFAPHIQPNHSASPAQIRMSVKNNHAPSKGTAPGSKPTRPLSPLYYNLCHPPLHESTLPFDEISPFPHTCNEFHCSLRHSGNFLLLLLSKCSPLIISVSCSLFISQYLLIYLLLCKPLMLGLLLALAACLMRYMYKSIFLLALFNSASSSRYSIISRSRVSQKG